MSKTTEPQLTEEAVREIEVRMNKTPEGPWFVAADAAKECGPHRDSGLALVDTGRESDWPIARLCEWHKARFIAHSREDVAALIRDWKAMRARIEHFESPDGEGKCRFCGNLRDVPHGHIQKCYCVPTIRQYRDENAALREQLAAAHDERWHTSLLLTSTQAERDELQSQLAQVTSERDRVWQEAVQIARDEAESAAGRAWRIRDRYGDEGRDEEDAEMIACESARNIERALERAAKMAHDGITEEDIADTLNPTHYPENR